MEKIPRERQTQLFSATWPKEIQRLAHDFLKDPVQINVGEVDALVANKDIEQHIVMCSENEKLDKLTAILKELTAEAGGDTDPARIAGGGKHHEKIIVFVAKKISCHDLANRLWDDGFAVDSLHGDRPQWERSKVMGAFKQGTLRMLIATDVAARGLDVKDVGVVVKLVFTNPNVVVAASSKIAQVLCHNDAVAKGIIEPHQAHGGAYIPPTDFAQKAIGIGFVHAPTALVVAADTAALEPVPRLDESLMGRGRCWMGGRKEGWFFLATGD